MKDENQGHTGQECISAKTRRDSRYKIHNRYRQELPFDRHIPIHLAIMGLRRSEICALKIGVLEGNVLCVHRAAVYNENGEVVNKDYPKTPGSFRYIRLPETLAKKIRDSGEITKMKPNNLTDAFRRFVRSNGFPDMRLHDCRHFMASYLYEQGVSDAEIMRMGDGGRIMS